MMTRNVGTVDRVIRVVIGIVLLSLLSLLWLSGPERWLGLLAVIPLATAAAGSCPIYSLLHIATVRRTGERSR